MFSNMKIGTKILMVMLATALGALLLISVISYVEMLNLTKYSENANVQLGVTASEESSDALLNQADEYLTKVVRGQASYNDGILHQVEIEVSTARDYIENLYANADNFIGYIPPLPDQTKDGETCAKGFIAANGEMTPELEAEFKLISNAEYAFAPIYSHDSVIDNLYLGTESGISYRYSPYNSFDPTYDPRERGWYTAASEVNGDITWVDTYIDSYGELCVTCAAAFKDKSGKIKGVVATDLYMSSLVENILSTRIGKEGYSFLLGADGKYLAHPDYSTEGFIDDPKVDATLDWIETVDDMVSGNSDVRVVTINGQESYVAYAPLETTGWTLAVTVPISEVTQPAYDTKEEINVYTDTARTYIEGTLSEVLNRFITLFAICTLIFVLFAFILSNTITRPIKRLVHSVHKIGSGDLDAKIEVKGQDEISDLGHAFNSMTKELKEYIKNLTKVTAEKERIGTELSVATEIQASMLPRVFPDSEEFELFASMHPAKEVGGDFYDFFMIDDRHLGLVMADVSGKGVPAALFMVISKSFIKNRSLMGGTPSEILSFVNNQLCEANSAEMFVTTWLGIMDLDTGIVKAVSAGHEFPAIQKANGKFELFKDPHGFVLAGMEDMRYKDYEFTIEPGGALYLYTDGVAEATNNDNQLFGTDRMIDALNKDPNAKPEDILKNVREDIDIFVGEADQFDDITMLALRYKGKKS